MPLLLKDSRRIAYSKVGAGSPLVFIHGSFAASAAWRKIIANLDCESHCALAVDLPGSGESEAVPFDPSRLMTIEAETVEAVAASEVSTPVHLVAHSHGAVIALAIALRGHMAIRALTFFDPVPVGVLANTAHAEVLAEMVGFVAEYRRAYEGGDQYAARRVVDRLGGDGAFDAMPERAREAVKAGTPQNICHWQTNLTFRPSPEQYGALRVPATIVRGEKSRPIDRLIGQSLSELLPNSRLIELAGAGHFMINTHPVECADIIGPTDRRSGPAGAGR